MQTECCPTALCLGHPSLWIGQSVCSQKKSTGISCWWQYKVGKAIYENFNHLGKLRKMHMFAWFANAHFLVSQLQPEWTVENHRIGGILLCTVVQRGWALLLTRLWFWKWLGLLGHTVDYCSSEGIPCFHQPPLRTVLT